MAKSGPIDGAGLAMTFIGGICIYAGIKGYSIFSLLNNLITGKPITTDITILHPLGSTSNIDTSTIPPIGSSTSKDINTNPRAIGMTQAAARGWTGKEWDDLDKLWTDESGWNPLAQNPSSGAFGIPQALPYTKMPQAAWPTSAGGHADALTQIQWGLSYIANRYGSPSKAYAAWLSRNPHWY